MKTETKVSIADINGEVRATVERESLRHPVPILIDVSSALSVREARGLAAAITKACNDHQKWRETAAGRSL